MPYYIERRTRIRVAATTAAALIIIITLSLALGFGGILHSSPAATTQPTTQAPPTTALTQAPALSELSTRAKDLEHTLASLPDPASTPYLILSKTVTRAGAVIVSNSTSGTDRGLVVKFSTPGYSTKSCFSLTPTSVITTPC
jgi:hypothetical protein